VGYGSVAILLAATSSIARRAEGKGDDRGRFIGGEASDLVLAAVLAAFIEPAADAGLSAILASAPPKPWGHHWPISSQKTRNETSRGRSTRMDLRIVMSLMIFSPRDV
jgi:hypothetical protein